MAMEQSTIEHRTAIFRQINKEISRAHHDAVEFSDGKIVLLTLLKEGQQATVLQLPVASTTFRDLDKRTFESGRADTERTRSR